MEAMAVFNIWEEVIMLSITTISSGEIYRTVCSLPYDSTFCSGIDTEPKFTGVESARLRHAVDHLTKHLDGSSSHNSMPIRLDLRLLFSFSQCVDKRLVVDLDKSDTAGFECCKVVGPEFWPVLKEGKMTMGGLVLDVVVEGARKERILLC